MRKYELMMILDASHTEGDRDALITAVEADLQEAGVKIISRDHPGERDLAYTIRGSKKGYYLLYTIEKEGDLVSVSNAFNLKKDIWRYMFTKVEA